MYVQLFNHIFYFFYKFSFYQPNLDFSQTSLLF